jgi:hypothetical protein
MSTDPSSSEQEQLERLYKSLYEPWGLNDIKRSSSPRLAFLGLVNWIDQVSRLATGVKNGEAAWRRFSKNYLRRHVTEVEIRLLYRGLRSKLDHEYGTGDVLLTHGHPERHWHTVDAHLVLNLDSLIDEFDEAFRAFYAELTRDAQLRADVLQRSQGLLAPVKVAEMSASVASSATISLSGAFAASATAPGSTGIKRDEKGWTY